MTLQKTVEHIGKLQQERQQLQDEVKRLREEIEELNTSIRYVRVTAALRTLFFLQFFQKKLRTSKTVILVIFNGWVKQFIIKQLCD